VGIEDDVLIRPLKLLLKGLLKALGFRQQKDFPAAEQHLDELLQQYVGLSRALVDMSSLETLRALLTAGGELDVAKSLALAHILAERAALSEALGRADHASAEREKALGLLLAVAEGPVALPDASEALRAQLAAR